MSGEPYDVGIALLVIPLALYLLFRESIHTFLADVFCFGAGLLDFCRRR